MIYIRWRVCRNSIVKQHKKSEILNPSLLNTGPEADNCTTYLRIVVIINLLQPHYKFTSRFGKVFQTLLIQYKGTKSKVSLRAQINQQAFCTEEKRGGNIPGHEHLKLWYSNLYAFLQQWSKLGTLLQNTFQNPVHGI